MDAIVFREAEEHDAEKIAEIIVGDEHAPLSNAVTKTLSIAYEDAKALFVALAKVQENWRMTTLAALNGQIVAILQVEDPRSDRSRKNLGRILFRHIPTLLQTAISRIGFRFVKKLRPGIQILDRIEIDHPPEAYYIAELHVDSNYHGLGIGTKMMAFAVQDARSKGYQVMALQVRIDNPAVKLYQRFGFEIEQRKTDAEFEQLTGSPGNYLMIKQL